MDFTRHCGFIFDLSGGQEGLFYVNQVICTCPVIAIVLEPMKETQWHSSKWEFLPSNSTYKTKTSAGNTLNFIRGNENVTHSAQGEPVFFFWGGGGDFLFRISEYTQRERICSFRKLQIFISQTTDSHFANYRFSFRKLQILISQTTGFHFVSSHFVSQTTVSRCKLVVN